MGLASQLDAIQALPPWLKFLASTGSYSGTSPATAGTYGIRVDATDRLGGHVAEAFHLYVA